ncbi:hypothetical protein lerEdw1_001579, partial [Lerista edwardsae]
MHGAGEETAAAEQPEPGDISARASAATCSLAETHRGREELLGTPEDPPASSPALLPTPTPSAPGEASRASSCRLESPGSQSQKDSGPSMTLFFSKSGEGRAGGLNTGIASLPVLQK